MKTSTPLLDRIVVVDTETGGLDPLQFSILSVGLVSWDGAHRMELFVAEPEIRCDPRSLAVNGLDPAWIRANGLPPAEACKAIDGFLDRMGVERPIIAAGHNIAFDIAFLRRLYALGGASIPSDFSHRTVDTHTLLWALAARGVLPPDVRSSDAAFAHFGVAPPEGTRHTALGDALATRELLRHLLELMK